MKIRNKILKAALSFRHKGFGPCNHDETETSPGKFGCVDNLVQVNMYLFNMVVVEEVA